MAFGNVSPLTDVGATAVAISAGLPADASKADVPYSGMYVIFENHRYLLAVRNGRYLMTDISVYSDYGMLLTDATDVYISAIVEGSLDGAKKVLGYVGEGIQQAAFSLGTLLVGALALFAAYTLFTQSAGRRDARD